MFSTYNGVCKKGTSVLIEPFPIKYHNYYQPHKDFYDLTTLLRIIDKMTKIIENKLFICERSVNKKISYRTLNIVHCKKKRTSFTDIVITIGTPVQLVVY